MSTRHLLAVCAVSAVFASLTLAGCATPEAPAAAPTAPPAASATPTQVAEPVVESVVITAESITLVGDDGSVLLESGYFEPTDDLVALLTETAGEAPEVEEDVSYPERGPLDLITWPGLEIYDDEGDGTAPHYPGFSVRVTDDVLGSASIETVDGIKVGESGSAVAAQYPNSTDEVDGQLDIYVGAVALPDSSEGTDLELRVWLMTKDADGPITEFRSPSANFGV